MRSGSLNDIAVREQLLSRFPKHISPAFRTMLTAGHGNSRGQTARRCGHGRTHNLGSQAILGLTRIWCRRAGRKRASTLE